MRKLQIKTASGWAYVFCYRGDNPEEVVTTDNKSIALPSGAMWADDDLKFFQNKYPCRNFRLAETLDEKVGETA